MGGTPYLELDRHGLEWFLMKLIVLFENWLITIISFTIFVVVYIRKSKNSGKIAICIVIIIILYSIYI